MENFVEKICPETQKLLKVFQEILSSIPNSMCCIVGGWVRDTMTGNKIPRDIDLIMYFDDVPLFIEHLEKKFIFYKKLRNQLKKFATEVHVNMISLLNYDVDIREINGERIELSSLIENDLRSRDFTVNSIYFDVIKQEVIDPLGGIKDLKEGVLRCTKNTNITFKMDYSRFPRLVRLMCELNFGIDKEINDFFISGRKDWAIASDTKLKRFKSDNRKLIKSDSMVEIFKKIFDLNIYLIIEKRDTESKRKELFEMLSKVQTATKYSKFLKLEKIKFTTCMMKIVYKDFEDEINSWLQMFDVELARDFNQFERHSNWITGIIEKSNNPIQDLHKTMDDISEYSKNYIRDERLKLICLLLAFLLYKLKRLEDLEQFGNLVDDFFLDFCTSEKNIVKEKIKSLFVEALREKDKIKFEKVFELITTISIVRICEDHITIENFILELLSGCLNFKNVFIDFESLMEDFLNEMRSVSTYQPSNDEIWKLFVGCLKKSYQKVL